MFACSRRIPPSPAEAGFKPPHYRLQRNEDNRGLRPQDFFVPFFRKKYRSQSSTGGSFAAFWSAKSGAKTDPPTKKGRTRGVRSALGTAVEVDGVINSDPVGTNVDGSATAVQDGTLEINGTTYVVRELASQEMKNSAGATWDAATAGNAILTWSSSFGDQIDIVASNNDGMGTVSYTHLDVYKRQSLARCCSAQASFTAWRTSCSGMSHSSRQSLVSRSAATRSQVKAMKGRI